MNIFSRYTSVIGLDIGPKKIILVTLKKDKHGLKIIHLVSSATPEDSISGGVITRPKEVGRSIKELLINNGIKSRDIIVSCGGLGVVLHLSKFPAVSDSEIREAIQAQLGKFVVFAGFPTVSDYKHLETVTEDGIKKAKVLLVASKKTILESYVKTAKYAGCRIVAIDEDSLAMLRSFYDDILIGTNHDGVIAVMVGFDSSVISILQDGQIHYVHTMDIGIKGEKDIKEFLIRFIPEIENIVKYYDAQFQGHTRIRKIYLTGEVNDIFKWSKDPNKRLTASGIIIEPGDPLKGVKFDNDDLKDHAVSLGLSLSCAIGLAMRGMHAGKFSVDIDLLPIEAVRSIEWTKRLRRMSYLSCSAVALGILLYGIISLNIRFIRNQIGIIQKQVKDLPSSFSDSLRLERKTQEASRELSIQNKILEDAKLKTWDEILNEIRRIIPKDARLLEFSSSGEDNLSFRGEAISQAGVFDFEQSLKVSPYFKDVKLGAVESRRKPNSFVKFTMECRLMGKEDFRKKQDR